MKVQGRKKSGRPKRRWLDKVKDDTKEKGLLVDDVYAYDRATQWRIQSWSQGGFPYVANVSGW